MNHSLIEHEHCEIPYCAICDGGLAVCQVCGCIEGSLASECPGVDCYFTHGDRIYNGEVDFIHGQWITLNKKEPNHDQAR